MGLDSRFVEFKGPQSLRALAAICEFDAADKEDVLIEGVSSSNSAGPGEVCFHEGRAEEAAKVSPEAAACFVREEAASFLPNGVIPLIVKRPRWSHILAAQALFRQRGWLEDGAAPSIHPTARVANTAYIGAGAAIGKDAVIGPNVSIGPGVQIGARTVINPGATVQCALIGNDVIIAAGARIGESGFGVTTGPTGAEDIPQWGRVILQDFVSIGANTCVDRGAFDDTIIGERSKIDNTCQIAHNVVIGRNVVMAGFSGISGSCIIGDGVVIGARVGFTDHVKVGAGAKIAAGAGIFRDIPAGETWGGLPAKPLRQYLREVAWIQKQVTEKKKPK